MNREEWESRLKSLELLIQGAILEFEADTGIKIWEISVNYARFDKPVSITVDI